MKRMMAEVTTKGTPISSKIKICKTLITKNSLAVAPKVLEMIKKSAPVL